MSAHLFCVLEILITLYLSKDWSKSLQFFTKIINGWVRLEFLVIRSWTFWLSIPILILLMYNWDAVSRPIWSTHASAVSTSPVPMNFAKPKYYCLFLVLITSPTAIKLSLMEPSTLILNQSVLDSFQELSIIWEFTVWGGCTMILFWEQ